MMAAQPSGLRARFVTLQTGEMILILLVKIEHRELAVRPIAQRERTDSFITGGGSTDYPEVFDVRLNDNYYRMQ